MAKIKEVRAQNPEYTIDLVDILASKDPTKTNKYLPFMISQTKDWLDWFKGELEKNTFKEMFDIVKEFDELSERKLLENRDIYSYDNNQDIVDEIKLAREKVTRSEVKKKETVVLYEDEKWLLLQPLTSRSSNLYGKSTKWCVSSEDHNFKKYFTDYTKDGVLVFLIDKTVKERDTRKEENNLAKLAFHKYKNKENKSLTIWNVKDTQLGVGDMMDVYKKVPSTVMDVINDCLDGDANQTIAESKKLKLD
jgi:hypothetical protein